MPEPHSPHSLRRVLIVVVPVAILGLGAYLWSSTLEPAARSEMSENVFSRILSTNAAIARAPKSYPDKDGDLVADSPDDLAQCIAPEVLTFSFVAGETESVAEDGWKEVFAVLAEKTGREVKFVH
ncbi:MAG: hypothetical protein WD229_18570, partial [Pirellulales bacterium]